MTLDPRDRKSWQGFLDLLEPPPGFRLGAALGTSFGLSIDALTAALLAMCGADGESLAGDPVAGVMAVTRLRSRVRVLVHPGTVSGGTHAAGNRFVAMLDRLIVEVDPGRGLFHPKVWALKFDPINQSRESDSPIGRIVVSSRNLASSTCFEMVAFFEGKPAADGRPSAFCADVAGAIDAWVASARGRVPLEVARLSSFVRQLALEELPREAADECRFRWQAVGRRSLLSHLPPRASAAVLVSPFVQPAFIHELLQRVGRVQILSTAPALDALDDETFAALERVAAAQRLPVLYQVTEVGEPDGVFINDVHAKLLMLERDGESVTYIGSANATPPGWGLTAPANVEAMVEMRPGLGIDRFISAFVRQDKTKVHPWIAEYDRSAKSAHPDQESERRVLAALRYIAAMEVDLAYNGHDQVLTVNRGSRRPMRLQELYPDVGFEFVPLLLSDRGDAWTPVHRLDSGSCRFEGVPLERLTAFVALRARMKEPAVERTRLLLAKLSVSDEELDRRDTLVREEVMATADPAAVLNALIRGLSYGPLSRSAHERRPVESPGAFSHVLQHAGLERVLQSVAAMPELVAEMRLLLRQHGGTQFDGFCDDLDAALAETQAERR